ncbi:MAG: YHS domain-containing (seleno)protein [Gemmobacter sp.]
MRLSRRSLMALAMTTLVAAPAATLISLRRSHAEAVAPVFAEGGVAIRGVDPVAYFTDGRVRRGDAAIHADWMGAQWLFATEEHRAMFAADPQAFAPQFGGYCSWAVAQGYTASVDPEAWRIVEGKLYLNYSRSIQRKWERDVPGNIARANGNWPGLKG